MAMLQRLGQFPGQLLVNRAAERGVERQQPLIDGQQRQPLLTAIRQQTLFLSGGMNAGPSVPAKRTP